MTRTRFDGRVMLAALLISAGALAAMPGGSDYDLSWRTIDGGGGDCEGGGFILTGTIGQPDATPVMAGSGYAMVGGFWSFDGGMVAGCEGDADGTGEVDVADLLIVLGAFGTADPAADVAPPGGDGIVDVNDLLAVLSGWGDCP